MSDSHRTAVGCELCSGLFRRGLEGRNQALLPPDADTKAVATTLLSIMQGLIVMHHVVDDVPAHTLRTGLALLRAATRTPPAAPASSTQTDT